MVFEACVMIIKNVFYYKKIVSDFSLEYINRFKNTTLSPFFFKIESLAWLENDIRNVNRRRKRSKRGGKFDIQKSIEKLGVEFHPYSFKKKKRYQYLGPGTILKKRLARGDPGINRLDRIAKQHDIDYSKARHIQDKWKADDKMVAAIDALPGPKSYMEKLSRHIIAAKKEVCICN